MKVSPVSCTSQQSLEAAHSVETLLGDVEACLELFQRYLWKQINKGWVQKSPAASHHAVRAGMEDGSNLCCSPKTPKIWLHAKPICLWDAKLRNSLMAPNLSPHLWMVTFGWHSLQGYLLALFSAFNLVWAGSLLRQVFLDSSLNVCFLLMAPRGFNACFVPNQPFLKPSWFNGKTFWSPPQNLYASFLKPCVSNVCWSLGALLYYPEPEDLLHSELPVIYVLEFVTLKSFTAQTLPCKFGFARTVYVASFFL